jgi:hypothetical protein
MFSLKQAMHRSNCLTMLAKRKPAHPGEARHTAASYKVKRRDIELRTVERDAGQCQNWVLLGLQERYGCDQPKARTSQGCLLLYVRRTAEPPLFKRMKTKENISSRGRLAVAGAYLCPESERLRKRKLS